MTIPYKKHITYEEVHVGKQTQQIPLGKRLWKVGMKQMEEIINNGQQLDLQANIMMAPISRLKKTGHTTKKDGQTKQMMIIYESRTSQDNHLWKNN